jgi:hypothetical protein
MEALLQKYNEGLEESSNILDKTDKSISSAFGGKIKKRHRYDWAGESKPGIFMEIDKYDLNLDGSYQRKQHSVEKVREIARRFDWKLFGALSVVMRKDGSFWVFDGGHRTRASFYRDDINELPCMVFESSKKEEDERVEEAKKFLGANLLVNNVSAVEKHRAGITAKDDIDIVVNRILCEHGYRPSGSGYSAQYQFRGIGTLKQMVKEDANLAAEIFKVCADIAKGGGEIPVNCLRGLYVLVLHMKDKENILSDKYIGKLKDIGMAGIEDAIRNEKYLAGKGGATVEAKAIIGLLNKGERRKLKWY